MSHGPYGRLNLNSLYISKGQYTKRYPKPQLNESQTGEDLLSTEKEQRTMVLSWPRYKSEESKR